MTAVLFHPGIILPARTLFFDPFDDLTGWTDADGGSGASTQATYDGEETLQLDSGGSTGGGNFARREYTVSGLPDKYVAEIRVYHQALGTLSGNDNFFLAVELAGVRLTALFGTDGLFINDGGSNNEIGSNIVPTGTWTDWRFEMAGATPASATVRILKDGVEQAAAADASHTGSWTAGKISLGQNGITTANRISNVDYLRITI